MTVISIAPMPNLAAALARDPHIARRARFVGMDGSGVPAIHPPVPQAGTLRWRTAGRTTRASGGKAKRYELYRFQFAFAL